MLRDEQQRNLDDLERWLKAVEREDFPESFPAQSNIVWETHLPMLYLLEEKEFNRAHSFVMERHTPRKQAEKDANQPLAVYGPQGRRLTDSPKRQKWRTQADFSR
jgi:hypothetical protein